MFLTKMEDIQTEFGGSPRKQTKMETLVEGFKSVHNAKAAATLEGRKFVISRKGRPLNITTMPSELLRTFLLPAEYEKLFSSKDEDKQPPSSGTFAGFSNVFAAKSPIVNDEDSRRISLAAKRMFMELGASLEVTYAYNDGDILIVEVKKNATPESMIEAVFDSGEHPEGHDNFRISFGLLKDIV
jgi:hypothetical protein